VTRNCENGQTYHILDHPPNCFPFLSTLHALPQLEGEMFWRIVKHMIGCMKDGGNAGVKSFVGAAF